MRSAILILLSFTTSAVALPFTLSSLILHIRQTPTLVSETDILLFTDTLPEFETARNTNNPSGLDYSSDPLGFNYLPACHRHDFGYQNYRIQGRFTKCAKALIDENFKKDLDYQCSFEEFESACRDLAEVYYEAMKEFGGEDATDC
jgi:hypothetical protein